MVRIAHVTEAAVRGVNGIAASIRLLTGELDRRGHDNLVASAGGAGAGAYEGIDVPSLPTGAGDFRAVPFPLSALQRRVRAWRPDLIHVHTPGPLGAAGLTLARRLGIPAVCTYHTDMHGYSDFYRLPAGVIAGAAAVYGRQLRRSNAVTALGGARYTAIEAAEDRFFGGAHVIVVPTAAVLRRCRIVSAYAARIRVIATPPGPRPPPAYDFRLRFGIAADARIVLFVGRIAPEKGIGLLLDAYAAARARHPQVLVLAGPVIRPAALRRRVARTGIAAHTVVTGALTPAEVQAAYLAADVFAFPSTTDTQGIVLHEAALAGLPLVLVDPALHAAHPLAPAMRLAAPDPSAFAAALLDPGHGAPARALAARLTPDRFATEILAAYRSALHG